MLVSNANWWDRFSKRCARLYQRPMLFVFPLTILGVGLAAVFPVWAPWSLVASFGMVTWLVCAVGARYRFVLPAMMLALPAVAAWRYQAQEQWIALDRLYDLASESSSPVVLRGSIESTPHWRPDLLKLSDSPQDADLASDELWETLVEVYVTAIRDRREWVPSEYGHMQIVIRGRLRDLLPGDQVECMLDWQRIMPPTNPGQYDLSAKYRRSGIFVRGRTDSATQIKKIGRANGWRFDRWLSRIVVAADVAFHRYVPYRQATLASALVLGQREQVEWAMQESLLATGTIHMLAISGMHIEMVAVSVVFLCLIFRVPRHAMLLATMSIVVAYSLLCGGNPPVARAAILVVTLGIGKWIGKTSNSMNLLGLAAVVVLLYRPSNWLEIGTQLSFLAVAILILLSSNATEDANRRDYLDELLVARSHPIWKGWVYFSTYSYELLRISFWVWLLTAPLVLYRFNVLSPIAVILNFLLWIPMLFSLLSGLVLLVVGPISPILSYPIGWFCGVNLWITDRVVQTSEKIPLSHFWLPAPPTWWIILFYIVIFSIISFFGFERFARRSILWFACLWIAIGIVPSLDRQCGPWLPGNRINPTDRLTVTFIDVGHGTSVLIQTPEGTTWLYDAGRLGNSQRSYLGIAGVLWKSRISKIDRLFLSHSDSDHFNAIIGLSKRFAIDQFITTQRTLDSESRSLQSTVGRLRNLGVPIVLRHESEILEEGTIRCRFLHPPMAGVPGNDNANSLCIMIEFAGQRILLPGDLEGEGTKRLIAQPPQRVSVLMVPHHGSLAESPSPLLDWCQPKVAVISGGSKAKNPKVYTAYQAADRKVLITAVEHAIRCSISRSGEIEIERWQHPKWVGWQGKQGL